MTTTGNGMAGVYVRARPFPDIGYPHRKGWFNTKTNFSDQSSTAAMYEAPSGTNTSAVSFAQRKWSAGNAALRSVTADLDLTTPAYMLSGSNVVSDSLVGLDYHNPPLKLYEHLFAMNNINDQAGTGQSYVRTLAFNHKLHITNFHRFPLKIYYSVYPSGYVPQNLNQTTPVHDLTNSAYQCITIPPVRDGGDRGRSRTLNLTQNLQKLFVNGYEKLPFQSSSVQAVDSSHEETPWIKTDATTTDSMYRGCPPGQRTQETPTTVSPDLSGPNPALFLKMYAQYDFPVWLGETTTTTTGDGRIDTAGFTIEGDMNWLVEYVCSKRDAVGHRGEKAYPSQSD